MYPSYATMWALKKYDINTVHDITGHIINLAPKGGTPDTYYRIMFDILGVKPKNIVNSGFTDLVGQMKDGMIEAGAGTGGSPFGPAIETEATHEINLISFSDEDMDKIMGELPSWFKGKIKKGRLQMPDRGSSHATVLEHPHHQQGSSRGLGICLDQGLFRELGLLPGCVQANHGHKT